MSIRSNVDRAGLDQRVRFERNSAGQDANGFPTGTWSSLGEVWARVDATKASEVFVADAMRSVGAMTLWIRAEVQSRLRLTSADRAVWKRPGGDVTLNILDVLDQQLRGRMVAVIAQSGLNLG